MSDTAKVRADTVTIRRWVTIPDSRHLLPGIDAVFFDSSATTSFASGQERRDFRERWLGRYLGHYPEWAYVALDQEGAAIGYIIGSLDDPAKSALFSDIAYFQDFAALTAAYPAQLHVNLSPSWRGFGIGARLVQAFAADAARAGAAGVHVVTGRGMRNVRYYEVNGFAEVGSTVRNGKELVFLGRKLGV